MSDEALGQDVVVNLLSREERDAVGEISLVSMGAAASTLSLLIGRDVDVSPANIQEHTSLSGLEEPFGGTDKILVEIRHIKGLAATTLLILRLADVRRLIDYLLGPSETTDAAETTALSELQTGALSELMNQILNASATGLASLLHAAVEIGSPTISPYTSDSLAQALPALQTEPFLVNRLQWLITEDAPVDVWEIRTIAEVKAQVAAVLARVGSMDAPAPESDDEDEYGNEHDEEENDDMSISATPPPSGQSGEFSGGGQYGGMPDGSGGAGASNPVEPVMVRPVQFSSFDQHPHAAAEENKNLALVMDVTLNLTVELGKTELSIKDILELTRGSVIELDRVAGEPVDLMANGKLIAKGEVVVIEDNFGLRITSIISPAERLRSL